MIKNLNCLKTPKTSEYSIHSVKQLFKKKTSIILTKTAKHNFLVISKIEFSDCSISSIYLENTQWI